MEFEEPTRRSFLFVTTGAVAAVDVPFAAWPFIDQMSPDAVAVHKAGLHVDISKLQSGKSIFVRFNSGLIVIRHRTQKEIDSARSVRLDELKDQSSRNLAKPRLDASDVNRTVYRDGKILVMIPFCTRLGCVVISPAGNYDGWACPCCGSQYDTSGRVRYGPAPENLSIPRYRFWDQDRIQIDRTI
ncbi:MAG: ubiquinol-cytochrome c reductase iron-sulfur subunit [Hyphomicrobiales bacterium]|nr:ubiquinol-cytochrome c reductase iron-sulfur subunit [Hyphomicrobiales bacterium]